MGEKRSGILSVVGTPIGNLSDLAPRARDALASADVVLCEDTRVTGRLLAAFGLRVPLERCDENVMASRIGPTLERIAAGERVAFVSDAGMPAVSDPGQRLVDAALEAGLPIEVVPGPSAVTCALVASGLSSDHFFFEGFLPRRRSAQLRRLSELAAIPGALVVYESPHRIVDTLAVVAEAFPTRRVALCRELTKMHEEVVRGLAPNLATEVSARPEVKGECVVVIGPPTAEESQAQAPDPESLDEMISEGLAAGEPKSALARRLARELSLARSEVYGRIVEVSSREG